MNHVYILHHFILLLEKKKNKCLKINGLLNADKVIKTIFKFKINE